MYFQPFCIPCQITRIYEEIKLITTSREVQFALLSQMLEFYHQEIRAPTIMDENTAKLGTRARKLLQLISKCQDPYETLKKVSNETCMAIIDPIRSVLAPLSARDQFREACKFSILGNEIEFFITENEKSLDSTPIERLLKGVKLYQDDSDQLWSYLEGCNQILFLTDNAGEIVFDKLLLEVIKQHFPDLEIIVAVKEAPILNDATLIDAKEVGLASVCDEIITTSTGEIGLVLEHTSSKFRNYWYGVDLIIAKGMGHFESFHGNSHWFEHCPLVHMFKIKCSTIAHVLKIPKGKNLLIIMDS